MHRIVLRPRAAESKLSVRPPDAPCPDSGVDQVVVGQGTDMKDVSIDAVQCGAQSGNVKGRPPELRLPAPIRNQPKEARSAASPPVVGHRKAPHADAIDRGHTCREGLKAGKPERFQVSGCGGEDGDVPVVPNLRLDAEEHVLAYQKDGGIEAGFDRVDSGIYVMRKSVLTPAYRAAVAANAVPVFQLADLWPELIARGKLVGFAVPERFYDIGTPERLQEFEEKVRDYFEDSVSD